MDTVSGLTLKLVVSLLARAIESGVVGGLPYVSLGTVTVVVQVSPFFLNVPGHPPVNERATGAALTVIEAVPLDGRSVAESVVAPALTRVAVSGALTPLVKVA